MGPAPAPQDPSEPAAKRPKLDPRALAEASKNLTQTLKQLSSEVLTTKPEANTQKPKKEVIVSIILYSRSHKIHK